MKVVFLTLFISVVSSLNFTVGTSCALSTDCLPTLSCSNNICQLLPSHSGFSLFNATCALTSECSLNLACIDLLCKAPSPNIEACNYAKDCTDSSNVCLAHQCINTIVARVPIKAGFVILFLIAPIVFLVYASVLTAYIGKLCCFSQNKRKR